MSVGATAASGREPGRFSARRKTETILRLLGGESLDNLARELGVTAATLAQWREAVLAGARPR
jgi:transposase-like protein